MTAFSIGLLTYGLTWLFIALGPKLEGRRAASVIFMLLASVAVAAVSLVVAVAPVLVHYLAGRMNNTEDDPE
jgi:hypothetical protein